MSDSHFDLVCTQVTTSPSSEAIVTVSQQVTQSQKEGQSKEVESGVVAISDQISTGNVNANPLMVSSSPSHPNHQKHDEIQKTPSTTVGTSQQPSQVTKVSTQHTHISVYLLHRKHDIFIVQTLFCQY